MSSNLVKEKVFLNKSKYDDAERAHYCNLPVNLKSNTSDTKVEIADEFSKVRQQLRDQLGNVDPTLNLNDIIKRLSSLEAENKELKSKLNAVEARVVKLEKSGAPQAVQPAKEESNKKTDKKTKSAPAPAPVQTQPAAKKVDEVNDDDFELFGDDDEEESEEKKRITEERLAAYASKKEKKPALVAKSSVILDVKPWDDETDMKKLEESVRSVEMDGLLWGSSKLVPIAYGVKKLQITCVIEDDKVSTEELDEKICEFEDYVQSVDIVSFNKI